MRIIVTGDFHIDEPYLSELDKTSKEVFSYGKADIFVNVGDWFDKCKPSPAELRFSAKLIAKMKTLYKKIIILSGTGKHDILNDVSVVEFLKYQGIIPGGVTYEMEEDGKKFLFGHWMVHESKFAFGSGKHSIKDLKKKYDYILLGHQHSPQGDFQLGSLRYVTWNEVQDKAKRIAIIEDGVLKFVDLKSPIPMIDVESPEEIEKIKTESKVRLVINKWEDYKNWVGRFSEWEKKFVAFKPKMKFEKIIVSSTKQTEKKVATSLTKFAKNWLKEIKNVGIVKFLTERFKEENVI